MKQILVFILLALASMNLVDNVFEMACSLAVFMCGAYLGYNDGLRDGARKVFIKK